jgi:hypothetical protein
VITISTLRIHSIVRGCLHDYRRTFINLQFGPAFSGAWSLPFARYLCAITQTALPRRQRDH